MKPPPIVLVSRWMLSMQEHLQNLGMSATRAVEWSIDPEVHETPRRFAITETYGPHPSDRFLWKVRVLIAPEILDLDEEHQQAILLHEWGHVVDFLYPAMLAVGGPLNWAWLRPSKADMERWKNRSPYEIEQQADRLVLGLWGVEIRYRGPLLLQGWSGVLRPRDLF